MKYIDWMKRRINILAETKIIDFPETPEMIERKVQMNKRYFHEVWPEEEAELKISLEASKAAKAERTELRRQKRKEKHVEKRKGKIDYRTNKPGKRK
tara:strand:+ start:480 stop:770 length:291 start_codon:yes stop_codon:yes gene_type:complete